MSTAVAAHVAASKPVTIHDVAIKAGVSVSTAAHCVGKNHGAHSASTVAKVQKVAKELGYSNEYVTINHPSKRPANSLFSSRDAETAAMLKLRSEGHSNPEIAHRCGVSYEVVRRRIGCEPAELAHANHVLSGKVRSAKNQIKKNYQSQQLISAYNSKVEALNAELAKVKQMASEIESMQKSAAKASKATGTPLLRLLPPTKIN